jgi:hypothetical protein
MKRQRVGADADPAPEMGLLSTLCSGQYTTVAAPSPIGEASSRLIGRDYARLSLKRIFSQQPGICQ